MGVKSLVIFRKNAQKKNPKLSKTKVAEDIFERSVQSYKLLEERNSSLNIEDFEPVRKLAHLGGMTDSQILDTFCTEGKKIKATKLKTKYNKY